MKTIAKGKFDAAIFIALPIVGVAWFFMALFVVDIL